MGRLHDAVGDAPFIFVVGKGGVGKTTTAAALALSLADAGAAIQLISTDPAHSLQDVIGGVKCVGTLAIEEFDASSYAESWLARTRGPITELVERGTYLDSSDLAGFSELALPGVDELMAVLRLVDVAGENRRVVVDTAPTGHTLRLLDAASTHEGIAAALRSMADKASVVASTLTRRTIRFAGEAIIDELREYVRRYRDDVLGRAAFVLVARRDAVVEAESTRLAEALRARALRTVATVWTGAPGAASFGECVRVPLLEEPPRGCAALRAWSAAVQPCGHGRPDRATLPAAPAAATAPALPWLSERRLQLWLFAGKGGVGKTTCAAAFAVSLAEDRAVLLCSADPAGSLADVLDAGVSNVAATHLQLRTRQIDPAAELERLRGLYRRQVLDALDSMGLSDAATLDRRVIESLWELAPPGIDEIAALVVLLDQAESQETIVVDTAPTGHFLRLLEMPQLAVDWTHQILRLMLKYKVAGTGGNAAEALLRLARQLRALAELLRDPQRAGVLLVTLPEPVVAAETARLRERLQAARAPLVATILNRARPAVAACDAEILAPELVTPPLGLRALREFAATWNIVT
jgi:arsenite-transporting ATPase